MRVQSWDAGRRPERHWARLCGPAGQAGFGAFFTGGRFLDGRIASGAPPRLPLNLALVKNITVHKFYCGGYRPVDLVTLNRALAKQMAMYCNGMLRPHRSA
ncbi:hypothetical protein ERN12_05820 [Rhodobacteraceae bacterium]|nr:hypothetical protein ERN12_05820 [Paracoccaceae bacterium]